MPPTSLIFNNMLYSYHHINHLQQFQFLPINKRSPSLTQLSIKQAFIWGWVMRDGLGVGDEGWCLQYRNGNIIWEIISMKQSFLKQLKNVPTITVRDLQSKIKDRNRHRVGQQNNPHSHQSQTCDDLNVISPFYERTTHRPDCTCKYHKRQRGLVPKIKKVRTEANELLPNIKFTIPQEVQEERGSSKQVEALFQDWREDLSSEDLKRYYFQYLKTLPSFDKVKRLDKLDCHNLAFEEFLKNNYLVILQRKKKQESDKSKEREATSRAYKSSQKVLHKVYTEGNIDYQAYSDANKKEGLSYKDTSSKFDNLSSVREESSRDVRFKRLGMKSTGKTLQLVDEEQARSRREDNRRKKAKFLNSRPSFFGLIEDQQLLRELCMKLMNENKRVNKEAEMMVKQLVESDIQMYQKMIGDIEEDLEAGIKLRNLNNDEASVLIKIVLNKIQRQTQLLTKHKDVHYEHKSSLIDDLCNKYGWPKEDKIMELKQFWKMRQEKQNSNFSRSSFMNVPSKNRISRNNIESKESKKIKSKVKLKDENRMSGLQGEKSPSKFQNSVKFVDEEGSKSIIELAKPEQSFKYISAKPLAKMGIFNRKQKPKNSKFFAENEAKGMQNSKKSFGSSYKGYAKQVTFQQLQQIDDVVIQFSTSKSIKQHTSLQSQSRNSSMYLNLKNQVQRHIELNKRFLKRIEHNLIDNQCERLIIGMGEGIITKKRKIRAIYEALESEQIKQSEYYSDILKYLEIYEDYCDLVIKNRREKKSKTDPEQVALPTEQVIQKQREEEDMDICMLLDSLKNQRELKFIDLNLLKEEEDPKEELILKIPQYITKVEPKRKNKKQTFSHGSVDTSRQNSAERRRHQCGILQKDLGETVTVQCNNNWTPPSLELAYPQHSLPQNIIDFQMKMQRYRQVFRLSA